mgnify:CR=1 FL=1
MLRGRAAKRFKNYGELLYHEALYKDAERRRIAEQRHLEEESDELKDHCDTGNQVSHSMLTVEFLHRSALIHLSLSLSLCVCVTWNIVSMRNN